MSIVLSVIAQGKAPYFDLTLPHLHHLARRMGCDFHVSHAPRSETPTWLKLVLLPSLLNYDRIIMCDADILPNWRVLSEADLAPLLNSRLPVLATDQGQPRCDGRFEKWCLKHFPSIPVVKGLPYYNAGLMAWPQKQARILYERFRRLGRLPDELFHEQDFINVHLQVSQTPVEAMPFEMNWMAPQFEARTLQSARIIHFAGGHKKLISSYAGRIGSPGESNGAND